MNELINQSIHSLHRRDLSDDNTASKRYTDIYRYISVISPYIYGYLNTQARELSDGTDSSPGSRVYTDKFTDI